MNMDVQAPRNRYKVLHVYSWVAAGEDGNRGRDRDRDGDVSKMKI